MGSPAPNVPLPLPTTIKLKFSKHIFAKGEYKLIAKITCQLYMALVNKHLTKEICGLKHAVMLLIL